MKRILCLCALAGALLLAACNPVARVPTLEGAEREQALAYADPIAENLLAGLNNGDYEAFAQNFDDKMLDAIGPQEFAQLRERLIPRIGLYLSKEAQEVQDHDSMVTVVYKGVFEKAKNVSILLTLMKDAPHQVAGLYFQ